MRFAGFANRTEAGQRLAEAVAKAHFETPVVLALPRGGVPVASEVARKLKAPLDLLLVRKIGVPSQRELAAAAVVDGATHDIVYNEDVMQAVGLTESDVERLAIPELNEIQRRRSLYLKDRTPISVEGRTAIVVDDGIATGATAKAALLALRRRKPKALVLAVPVAPPETVRELRPLVDHLICLEQPVPFMAIGIFYADFHQLSDEEVVALLAAANPQK
jgi:putative phosphoribosyl transferase